MHVTVHPVSKERQTRRVVMQVIACLLVLLGLLLVATATLNPIFAISPDLALALAPTPSGSKTPLLLSTSSNRNNPRLIAGQTTVDANTISLFHFDEDASDAVGEHNASLVGAQIAPAEYGNGLSVANGSYARVQVGNDWGSLSQGTIEAYVDFSTACSGAASYFTILSAGADSGEANDVLVLRENTGLYFGIQENGRWHWVNDGINSCRYLAGRSGELWPYETWRFHHVAATWGPRGMELWIDGILHGVGTNDPNAGKQPYLYMCNPQMQMGMTPVPGGGYIFSNPLYPICQTPVMSSMMRYPPPGDYMGGVPSFSTVRIGCGSLGACFNGRIDEVRISNVQRTFNSTVIPTATPFPTPPPSDITQPYSVDSNTRALYHLDDSYPLNAINMVYNEVSDKHDGNYSSYAAIAPGGRFNSGLSIYGGVNSSGYWPQLTFNAGSLLSGTMEAWVNLNESTNLDIIRASSDRGGGSWQPRLILGVKPPANTIGFGVDGVNGWVWADSTAKPDDLVGAWHHVAGTWGSRGLEFWLDGERCATYPYYGTMVASIGQYGAGCDPNGVCLKGIIDEVRVSAIQRYYEPLYAAASRSRLRLSNSYLLFLPVISLAPTPTRVQCRAQ